MKTLPALLTFLLAVAACSGCLITRHTTNVVRKSEKPRTVKFENAQAKNIFDAKVLEAKARLDGMANPRVVAVPFLLWWSSTDVVSDNALRNDQLTICDANGDGIVTLAEADVFAAKVDEQLAKHAAETDSPAMQPANAAASKAPANLPTQPPYPAMPISAQQPIEQLER